MNKKIFSVPQVFLSTAQINGSGWGGYSNSGEMSIKPVPMSFSEWSQSRFVGDYDSDPGVDFEDYAKWFSANGFGSVTWDNFNPGVENGNESDS